MNEELKTQLQYLRLSGLLAHWDDYIKLAAEQRFSHSRLLIHILGQPMSQIGQHPAWAALEESCQTL